MYDVGKELYADIIRQMIRHENEVTNHRIMWLLIGQGFIANAFVTSGRENLTAGYLLALVGIFVTLSAFLMLYKSYLARGYLQLLGERAKQGTLPMEYLPITGWPEKRIKGWWRDFWVCPWIGQSMHLLEPFIFLPGLFIYFWLCVLLKQLDVFSPGVLGVVAGIGAVGILGLCCISFVWSERKGEVSLEEPVRTSRSDVVTASR